MLVALRIRNFRSIRDTSVLCMEEPENGIHPSRIPSLVELMYDYAVDVELPVGDDSPLRQVILNTHSPEVARQLSYDDVLFAERGFGADGVTTSVFRPVQDTWRTRDDEGPGGWPRTAGR